MVSWYKNYGNYVINVYYTFYIGIYTNDNSFHFDTFQLHLFYQNIAINILKLQEKLLLISVERVSNKSPQNNQYMID